MIPLDIHRARELAIGVTQGGFPLLLFNSYIDSMTKLEIQCSLLWRQKYQFFKIGFFFVKSVCDRQSIINIHFLLSKKRNRKPKKKHYFISPNMCVFSPSSSQSEMIKRYLRMWFFSATSAKTKVERLRRIRRRIKRRKLPG